MDYRLNSNIKSSFRASFLYENSNLDQTLDIQEFAYVGEQLYYDYYSGAYGNPVFFSFKRDVTPLAAYRVSVNYQQIFEHGNTMELGASSQLVCLEGSNEYDTVDPLTGDFACILLKYS